MNIKKSVLYLFTAITCLPFTTISSKASAQIDTTMINKTKEMIVEKTSKPAVKEEAPVNMAIVEQKPEFPGGEVGLRNWLNSQIQYPDAAAEKGVQGRVVVQFIVEKSGSISNVQVVRGKHPALDAEALRIVKKMPRWNPGRNGGQPVRVVYNVPVIFKLKQ